MRAKLNGLVAAGLFTCALSGHAAGPVTPDNDLRNDLARLSDRGVINVSLSTATEPKRSVPLSRRPSRSPIPRKTSSTACSAVSMP